MMAMKKNIAIIAVLVISFVTSYILCGTEQYDSGIDSIKLEEYTAVLGNRASLDSVAGTYCGVLPPNVETTLTLNAIKNSRQEKFYEFLIAFFIERLQHIIYNTSQGKRFYEKLYQKRVCYNSPNYG